MRRLAENNQTDRRPAILLAAAALCLVATGALLWHHLGPTLFNALVIAPLAWCL